MRILLTGINYAPEVTGIAPYTTGLAEGLAERGHQVDVVTGLPHYPEWRVADGWGSESGSTSTRNSVGIRRIHHHVPSVPSLKGRLRMEVSFGLHAVAARAPRPDLVLAVTPALIASAMVIARARVRGVPAGLIVQDLYGLGVRETGSAFGPAASSVSRFEATVFRRASGVAVIHDHFRDSVVEMGVDKEHVTVIRNWSHFTPAGTKRVSAEMSRRTRHAYGWREDEIVVLHAGNMGLKQGLDNVIEAARLADARNLPVRFVLVGDGNQRARLQEMAGGGGHLDMIDPLPEEEFRAIVAAADLLLVNELPGVREMAVPSKLTTYFAAAHPVIGAVDANGVTAGEIFSSGAGTVVPPGDPCALVEEACRLGHDEDQCTEFAACGPAYAHKVLSVRSAIDQYAEWCERLASQRGRASASVAYSPGAQQPSAATDPAGRWL
ncbi:glycosyltransferase [Gordonia jinghuaiqii]|uniref:Glycosyltransferase n=1 Tax=Gordonia jinghuaiqii TaxID=2758710 RepID=A0A7D7LYJ7_9ACTN|nr:glycosyltransferase [Gordonia jinghuaiqii]MCR5980387.1 glycosyltransferase [Gordonia jinghuaiqii]QMT01874.1 glycosyltransferase [Gordonia jinghuaiqii]